MESGSCESVVAEGSGVNRGASDIETRERATLLVTHSVNGPIATTNNLRIFFGEMIPKGSLTCSDSFIQ